MNECMACGVVAGADAHFCGSCGASLRSRCAACGAENPRTFRFCATCGSELLTERTASSNDQAEVAERRVITVLFCDMANSTALSGQLDPEDFAAVTASFQDMAAGIVRREGGFVSRVLGDGVLALFGYPVSHEDDGCRAVRAALGVVNAMQHLPGPPGVELAARAGATTGLVVVGRIGTAAVTVDVAGETANIAARLQALAEPGQVVIGDTTRRLVGDAFVCEALGPHELKGVARPIGVHRVVAQTDGRVGLGADTRTGRVPLVGRAHERSVMAERWERVLGGRTEVIVLTGEAGIGKSRLLSWLSAHAGQVPSIVVRCSADDRSSPLRPVVEELAYAAGILPGESPEERVRKVGLVVDDPDDLDALRPLFGVPSLGTPSSPDRQRAVVVDALWRWARTVAESGPGLIAVEDVHWADHTTLEWLVRAVDDVAGGRQLMIVVTARPEFIPPWPTYSHVTTLVVPRLDQATAAQLAAQVSLVSTLDPGVTAQIIERSEGVPLYVEELTRSVIEESTGDVPTVPASLYESMSARLDRIGPVRRTAQLVALLGTDVPSELVIAVADSPDDVTAAHLDVLVEQGLLERHGSPDTSYRFAHQLLGQVAREAMLHSRRRIIHERVARTLVDQFAERAGEQPWVVAHHFAEAELPEDGARWWVAAGHHASARFAPVEAIEHYTRAVELLRTAGEGPERDREELGLLFLLALLLMTAGDLRGLPDVARRATELSETLNDDRMRFQSHLITHAHASTRPLHRQSLESALAATSIAERLGSRGRLVSSLSGSCYAHFYLGETLPAMKDGLAAIELSEAGPEEARTSVDGIDPTFVARVFVALSLWQLGRFAEAAERLDDTRIRLNAAERTWAVAVAHVHLARVFQMVGDRVALLDVVSDAEPLGQERGHRQLELHLRCLRGWAESDPGDLAFGALLSESIDELASMERMSDASVLFADLATTELAAHRAQAARVAAVRGLDFAQSSGEHWLEPELHRLLAAAVHMNGDSERALAAIASGLVVADTIASRTQRLRLLTTAVELGADTDAAARLSEELDGWPDGAGWGDLARAKEVLSGALS
jgi:class 3 adenylate cyclase